MALGAGLEILGGGGGKEEGGGGDTEFDGVRVSCGLLLLLLLLLLLSLLLNSGRNVARKACERIFLKK